MSSDKSNITIAGGVDAGWTSYYNPEKMAEKRGETISGTSPDDEGEITTEWLPSHIDPGDLTDKQRSVLEAYYSFPDASRKRLAEMAGCTPPYVPYVLDKYVESEGKDEEVTDDSEDIDTPDEPTQDTDSVNMEADEPEPLSGELTVTHEVHVKQDGLSETVGMVAGIVLLASIIETVRGVLDR